MISGEKIRRKKSQAAQAARDELFAAAPELFRRVPAFESVARKFLRMTPAERTKFVELFGGFTSLDWRRFRAWIKKLKGEKL